MTIGHISLPTGNHFKEMRDFYLAILKPLGYGIFKESPPEWCGFGKPNSGPDFWLHCGGKNTGLFDGNLEKRAGKAHVAFEAGSEREVREWYGHAVTKIGALSNGEPGERPQYIKGYYAAYVIDPLGNNIEVVCWNPWWMKMLKTAPFVLSTALGAGLTFAYQYYYG